MLLWTSLLCLFSATLVASQFVAPEILAKYDPGTTLKPLKNNLEDKGPSENPHVIRDLLMVRQTSCPTGFAECTSGPGKCCQTGGVCCSSGCCKSGYYCYSTGCCPTGDNGCEGNSCCSTSQSCCKGGGCCDPGYSCAVVDGEHGCCPDGETCNDGAPQCTTPGFVLCPGESFCCPDEYQCLRDSAGTAKCNPPSSSIPSILSPTATFITSKGPSTIVLPTSSGSPTPTSDNSESGATSSALSVGVDLLLNLFAGIGALAFLF